MTTNRKKPHLDKALELAQMGIEFDASGQTVDAARSWQAASSYADSHLQGEDTYYWIKSGFGAALYEIGDYQGSIVESEIALDWCSGIKQPLPALTLAKCYLRLGEEDTARKYFSHACGLVGDNVLEHFRDDDLPILLQ